MTLSFLNLGSYEFILLALVILIPIFLMISILRSSRYTLTEKLLWILLIWFVPVIGILVYLIYSSTSKAR